MGAASESSTNLELDDVIGCVGRDPFAEEDGGAPLESGRVVNGATAPRSRARTKGYTVDAATTGAKGRKEGEALPSQGSASGARGRPAVSVLEDLWKLDPRTLLWERVSVASRLSGVGGFCDHFADLFFSTLRPGGQGFGGRGRVGGLRFYMLSITLHHRYFSSFRTMERAGSLRG